MKLLIHSPTSMVQPMKFGNREVISSHTWCVDVTDVKPVISHVFYRSCHTVTPDQCQRVSIHQPFDSLFGGFLVDKEKPKLHITGPFHKSHKEHVPYLIMHNSEHKCDIGIWDRCIMRFVRLVNFLVNKIQYHVDGVVRERRNSSALVR